MKTPAIAARLITLKTVADVLDAGGPAPTITVIGQDTGRYAVHLRMGTRDGLLGVAKTKTVREFASIEGVASTFEPLALRHFHLDLTQHQRKGPKATTKRGATARAQLQAAHAAKKAEDEHTAWLREMIAEVDAAPGVELNHDQVEAEFAELRATGHHPRFDAAPARRPRVQSTARGAKR